MFRKYSPGAGIVAQVIEYLPREHKALSSTCTTHKNKDENILLNSYYLDSRSDLYLGNFIHR
jgi:hypothetical protein